MYIFFFFKFCRQYVEPFFFLQNSKLTPICGPSSGIYGVDVFYKFIDVLFTRKFFTLVSMTGVTRSGPKKEGFIKFHRTFKFVLKLLNRCDPNISEVSLKAYFQKVIDNSRRRYEDWNRERPKRASSSKHFSLGSSKRQKLAKKMEPSGSEEEMSDEEQSNGGEEKPSVEAERGSIESGQPESTEETVISSLDTSGQIGGNIFIERDISTETASGAATEDFANGFVMNSMKTSAPGGCDVVSPSEPDEIVESTGENSDEELNSIFEPAIAIAANVASDVAAKVAAKVSADAARSFGLMVSVKTHYLSNVNKCECFPLLTQVHAKKNINAGHKKSTWDEEDREVTDANPIEDIERRKKNKNTHFKM